MEAGAATEEVQPDNWCEDAMEDRASGMHQQEAADKKEKFKGGAVATSATPLGAPPPSALYVTAPAPAPVIAGVSAPAVHPMPLLPPHFVLTATSAEVDMGAPAGRADDAVGATDPATVAPSIKEVGQNPDGVAAADANADDKDDGNFKDNGGKNKDKGKGKYTGKGKGKADAAGTPRAMTATTQLPAPYTPASSSAGHRRSASMGASEGVGMPQSATATSATPAAGSHYTTGESGGAASGGECTSDPASPPDTWLAHAHFFSEVTRGAAGGVGNHPGGGDPRRASTGADRGPPSAPLLSVPSPSQVAAAGRGGLGSRCHARRSAPTGEIWRTSNFPSGVVFPIERCVGASPRPDSPRPPGVHDSCAAGTAAFEAARMAMHHRLSASDGIGGIQALATHNPSWGSEVNGDDDKAEVEEAGALVRPNPVGGLEVTDDTAAATGVRGAAGWYSADEIEVDPRFASGVLIEPAGEERSEPAEGVVSTPFEEELSVTAEEELGVSAEEELSAPVGDEMSERSPSLDSDRTTDTVIIYTSCTSSEVSNDNGGGDGGDDDDLGGQEASYAAGSRGLAWGSFPDARRRPSPVEVAGGSGSLQSVDGGLVGRQSMDVLTAPRREVGRYERVHKSVDRRGHRRKPKGRRQPSRPSTDSRARAGPTGSGGPSSPPPVSEDGEGWVSHAGQGWFGALALSAHAQAQLADNPSWRPPPSDFVGPATGRPSGSDGGSAPDVRRMGATYIHNVKFQRSIPGGGGGFRRNLLDALKRRVRRLRERLMTRKAQQKEEELEEEEEEKKEKEEEEE